MIHAEKNVMHAGKICVMHAGEKMFGACLKMGIYAAGKESKCLRKIELNVTSR